MSYCIRGNILEVDNNKVFFENKIMQVLEVSGIIIVILDINSEKILIDNVYGVLNGKIIWKIQSYLELDLDFEQTSYVLAKKIDEREVIVTDFCGCKFKVNVSDGKITGRMSSMK